MLKKHFLRVSWTFEVPITGSRNSSLQSLCFFFVYVEECAATSDRKCADVDSGIEDRRQADTDKVDLCREGEKNKYHIC